MKTNICRVCRQTYIEEFEVYPRQGSYRFLCAKFACLQRSNCSGLCDYHYRRWQSSFYKRIQRWWRGRNVPALPKPDPRPVSFLESEL